MTSESNIAPSTSKPTDGRSNHTSRWKGKNNRVKHVSRTPKFEGTCDEMKGNVYDYDLGSQNTLDQFTTTTDVLCDYFGTKMESGSDIVRRIQGHTTDLFSKPVWSAACETGETKWDYDTARKDYNKRKFSFDKNNNTLFSLVWGQSTLTLRQKLQSTKAFKDLDSTKDGLGLLNLVRMTMYGDEQQANKASTIARSMRAFYSTKQGRYVAPKDYFQSFNNILRALEGLNGLFAIQPDIYNNVLDDFGIKKGSKEEGDNKKELEEAAHEQYFAACFLEGSDPHRYGALLTKLNQDELVGVDNYPRNLTAAYKLLVGWNKTIVSQHSGTTFSNDGVTFATINEESGSGETTLVNNGSNEQARKNKQHITCFNCNTKGHYASECTSPKIETKEVRDKESTDTHTALINDDSHTEFIFANHSTGVVLNIGDNGKLPMHWILLDNQSTVDIFANKDLLRNIYESNDSVKIHCNAGVTITKMKGTLPGYGEVWYHPNTIANILSLTRVLEKGYKVEYDSSGGNKFKVKKTNGDIKEFKQSTKGLFYYDTLEKQNSKNNEINLLETVMENAYNYTSRDVEKAKLARQLQINIGRPSTTHFIQLIKNNVIPNCPISVNDVIVAEDIFGTDIGILKGKTTRTSGIAVGGKPNTLPNTILDHYRDITLAVDVMFVNKISFLVTVSRNIKFATVEMITNMRGETLMKGIQQVSYIYAKRGFRVRSVLVDGQFNCVTNGLLELGITTNITSRDEHVSDVERYIRTLKERVRCVYNTLPFKNMPARLLIELVYNSNFWLNSLPSLSGISTQMSPREIITGLKIDYKRHCSLEFGCYVQTHEQHDNSMQSRTVGALALRPTGNEQGGHYFFSLTTGKILNRFKWTALPMPEDVKIRIEHMAKESSTASNLTFSDREGNILPLDEDDAELFEEEEDLLSDVTSQFGEGINIPNDIELLQNQNENPEDIIIIGDDNDGPEENMELGVIPEEAIDEFIAPAELANDDMNIGNIIPDDATRDEVQEVEYAAIPDNMVMVPNAEDTNIGDDPHQQAINERMDTLYGQRTKQYNLRPRKPLNQDHLLTQICENDYVCLSQYNVKQGLKRFGNAGRDAVMKELQQLHIRDVIEPVLGSSLSVTEKHAALPYLMFLKEKRNGVIKGRGCADGRKQRLHIDKGEASSPTVSIEAVMLSCVIDAHENRDVATVDIPGAFMHADMEDLVHMRLEGEMVDLLISIDKDKYGKFAYNSGGKETLYVRLNKALYGTLKAALLFWKKLSGLLLDWGFTANPYDNCVVNKTINGTQCTVLWHVDDLKISHVDPNVVSQIIHDLDQVFGKLAPLTINRGRVHEYLGMNIDFTTTGKVKLTMIGYIKETLKGLPDDMGGTACTPATDDLFDVSQGDSTTALLDKDRAEMFHHNVAKLLFLCKRTRPDVQTAISFLCTRVQSPNTDDYRKLSRVMKYLRGSINLPLTLEAANLQVIKWWVDASYGVHPDMKSHTGGVLSLGKGAIYATSTRQKLNTKSSTEAELVGVSDVISQVLWTKLFLEGQEYIIQDNIMYQDNKSAILLENNGKASSSKRTRHIHIRYFFVTDKIHNKDMTVEYCPTDDMIGDYFTKPLQGRLFYKFRGKIMNCEPDSDDPPKSDHRSVLDEDEKSRVSTTEEEEINQSQSRMPITNDMGQTVAVTGRTENEKIVK
jgi:Reverse transcriptase (RNA-dependent DNA polymerase)/Zinc knuckle